MKQTVSFSKNTGQKFYSLIKRNLVGCFLIKSNVFTSYSRQCQVFEATNLLSVDSTKKYTILKKNGLESSIKFWKCYFFFWVKILVNDNSFCRGCVWEGVGNRTELQHIDPHSYGHQRFFPVLLGCSTGGLGAQPLWVLVFFTASYLQLVWSPTAQSGVPRAPSSGCCFLYSIISPTLRSPNWLNFLCTELYNISMPTQSLPINGQRNMPLPLSLEWHVLIIIERK